MTADDEATHRLLIEGAVRAHRRRLQQTDELGEGLRVAVVGRGRGEDEGVGLAGQNVREPVVECALVGDVVRLVDDDRVPALLAQMIEIAVRLQRIDRDDRAVEHRERVARGRHRTAHPLDAHRVQAHEGQGEARPHLVLHLLEHVTGRDDENAVAPAAAHELGQNHADLQGLAQAHGVSQEDTRAQVRRVQGLANRRQLVGQRVGEDVTDHGQVGGGRWERRLA